MSIADTYFTCTETPAWIPTGYRMNNMIQCTTCRLRLSAPLAGPGSVSQVPIGLMLNENPTTSLYSNDIQHNLLDSYISFPSGHRLEGRTSPSDGECYFYFQNVTDPSKHICLCVPLDIGTGNEYFKNLGNVDGKRPTLATLIPTNTKIFSYRGPDLRGRSRLNMYPRGQCEPVNRIVTYFVTLTTASINANDFKRLKGLCASNAGPPKPMSELTSMRIQSLGTFIPSIQVKTTADVVKTKNSAGKSGIPTESLKCYAIDPDKDVKDDAVYIGGAPGDSTLADELRNAASGDLNQSLEAPPIANASLETILSIVLGVFVGLVVCATIAFFIYNTVFSHYPTNSKLYDTPISSDRLAIKIKVPDIAGAICKTPK